MNKFSKKTAFGITTAAAAALVVGFAAPAMASTGHDTSWNTGSTPGDSTTRSSSTVTQAQLDALREVTTGVTGGDVSTWTPLVISPQVGVGDVASGDAIGSGDDVPVLSGNTVSGNDVSAPVLSGDQTAVGNEDGDGDSISSSVQDLVNNTTKDLGNVMGNSASGTASGSSTGASSDVLGNVTGDLGLGTILGDR